MLVDVLMEKDHGKRKAGEICSVHPTRAEKWEEQKVARLATEDDKKTAAKKAETTTPTGGPPKTDGDKGTAGTGKS